MEELQELSFVAVFIAGSVNTTGVWSDTLKLLPVFSSNTIKRFYSQCSAEPTTAGYS